MSATRHPADGGMTFSKSVAIDGQGTWIYLSGQVGLDDSGHIVPDGTEANTLQTLELPIAAVTEAGDRREDVVRITGYLTCLDDHALYVARKQAFGDAAPASTPVQVAGLLRGAQVEIDAVAFVPAS